MTERVVVKFESSIAQVILNRPDKRNALDLAMFQAVRQAQIKIQKTRGIRVVILSGNGEDFCSGLDIKSMMSNRTAMIKLLWKWLPWQANLAQLMSHGWRKLPMPVITVIHGRCWGGGLQLALGADFRIAHPQSSLSIMESKWGLIPDMGGSLALRDISRLDQASRISMTAETIAAPEARKLGLLTEIDQDPLVKAIELAEKIKLRSPDAVALIKRLHRKNWNAGEGSALARETLYQFRVLSGKNQKIAVRREKGEKLEYRY